MTFFGQKSKKIFAQNPEKFRKEEWKKNFFFRKFYSAHVYRNLRTIPKVSAENPKRFKTFKKNFKPQIVPLRRVEGSFDKFLTFFGQKSEKNFAQNPEKFRKEEWKKNFFFRKFYSGHVYRNLRTMPKVSAENPKRFKTFKKYFKPQIVPLVTQKLVLTTFWRFFAESLKKFSLKIRKKLWREKSENCFFRKFYSGHVYRNLRTIPKASAENPKRFKTFKIYFKPQIVPLDA